MRAEAKLTHELKLKVTRLVEWFAILLGTAVMTTVFLFSNFQSKADSKDERDRSDVKFRDIGVKLDKILERLPRP